MQNRISGYVFVCLLPLCFSLFFIQAFASGPISEALAAGEKTDNGDGAQEGGILRIASWGGAYQTSQEKAYFKPFHSSSGIEVKALVHKKGTNGSLVSSMANGIDWDVADLTSGDVDAACSKGLIQPIEVEKILDSDGEGEEDFLPGAITKCGIGSVAWSSVIVVNRRKFPKRKPQTIKDFFNVARFKGKRALPRGPKYLLEMALLADGADSSEVYDLLETPEGENRAFDKLDRIRDHVVWWDHAGEPIRILEEGKAVMALSYSGRAFTEITSRLHPFDIIWDGQIYDVEYWVISKKVRNEEHAHQFLRYALAPERLAAQARLFPYGPMRKSAIALVGKHAHLDVDMQRYLPTRPAHLENALRLNTKWWADNEKRLKSRFEAWLKGEDQDAAPGPDDE